MADRLHSDASWLDGPSKCEMRRKEWRIVIHVIPLSSLNAASSMDPSVRSVRPCRSVHLSVRASVSASVSQCVIALQMLFIRKLKKKSLLIFVPLLKWEIASLFFSRFSWLFYFFFLLSFKRRLNFISTKNIIDKEDILIGPGQVKAADKVSQKQLYKIYTKYIQF